MIRGLIFGAVVACGFAQAHEEDTNAYWLERETETLQQILAERPITKRAKNIVLFLGDGMGISTITAARILAGQREDPERGEKYRLHMERLPYAALSKTYSVNQQTSDSAPTMTAIMSGVKTKDRLIGVGPSVVQRDHTSVNANNRLNNILHDAKRMGKSAGIVTTTRLTHATPASCFAHAPHRDWEDDADIKKDRPAAFEASYPDIARQLIEFAASNNLPQIEVALGGGRAKFRPKAEGSTGKRLDGRDLTAEWVEKFPKAAYVTNRQALMEINPESVDHLLGLFHDDQLNYFIDRTEAEPSLVDMTKKALEVLRKNERGYFLMVEGGRIDHGHHAGNALRALTDTIEFDEAIAFTVANTNPEETLIIVTADHSHTLTIGGYAQRGNPILDLVRVPHEDGTISTNYSLDHLGLPFTSLIYANGPGYTGASLDEVTIRGEKHYKEIAEGPKFYRHEPEKSLGIRHGRPLLTSEMVLSKNYLQEAAIPLGSETHGGEDVAIFASGPWAHLFRGVREQNYIYQVMKFSFENER